MGFSRNISLVAVLFSAFIAACFWNAAAIAGTGEVLSYQKISDTQGSFLGDVCDSDYLGCSVASIGDLNNDANSDIVVGAYGNDDGGAERGGIWIMFLRSNGTVKSFQEIAYLKGGFPGAGLLSNGDQFGYSVASIGDLDGDHINDIVVGAIGDDDGGTDRGAVWILFMNTNGTVKAFQKIGDLDGNFTGLLHDGDNFGSAVAGLGDLNRDNIPDIAVGANRDDTTDRGAVWILFLNSDGTVKSQQKIGYATGGFTGTLALSDLFGTSVSPAGDIDGDGVLDLAVGASKDNAGGTDKGAVWILFMNTNGTVRAHQKITAGAGNFTGPLDDSDLFGSSVCSLGDLDRDGIPDIAVGAIKDDDGDTDRGAVWILFLNSNGTVKSHQKISSAEGNFTGLLSYLNNFGSGLCALKDLNKDRITDLVAGAIWDDDGGTNTGAAWVLFLDACNYNLYGDANLDCHVDFDDFALMANNWLIDCKEVPADPNYCIPTR